MAQVSFDNGCNWYDNEDLEEIRQNIERLGMDTIAQYMDDDVRERCHAESDAETDAEWLADYLMMANEDLVIG